MSQKFEKLKALLKELFQLDQPDLDFGLYRIMHAKSAEVTQFLDQDLLPQVKQAFGLYKTDDKAELQKDLAKAIEQAQGLGVDPESVPRVRELRSKIANESIDIGGLRTGMLTDKPMNRIDAYRMIQRRAADLGTRSKIGCHTFRATGITAYLEAGGTLENAQAMAAHESPRTTKLYDRTGDEITLDEVERITI